MKSIERTANNKKGPINIMLIVIYLLAIVMVCVPEPSIGSTVGSFTDMRENVDLSRQGRPSPKKAKIGEEVEMNDAVNTDDSGKAQIKFIDGSLLTIAARSKIVVNNYLFDPNNKNRQVSLSAIKGFFHILLGYTIKSEQPDFILDTVTAVLGPRGTSWYTIAENNFTDVFCETGKLSIKSRDLEEMVVIGGYQATRVWKGKPPLPPLPITSNDLSRLKVLLDSGLPTGFNPGNNPSELLQNLINVQTSKPAQSWKPPPSPMPPTPIQAAPPAIAVKPLPPVAPPTPPPPPPQGRPGGHAH
jgi:hypothetical protein